MLKWVGLSFKKSHLWRCWDCLSIRYWFDVLVLSRLRELVLGTCDRWLLVWNLILLKLGLTCINLLTGFTWNTVTMHRLLFLTASFILLVSCRNRYVGLFVLHLQLLFDPWHVFEILPFLFLGIALRDPHLNWVNLFHFLLVDSLLVTLKACLICSNSITRCYKEMHSVIPRLARLWNTLHDFSSRVSRRLAFLYQ